MVIITDPTDSSISTIAVSISSASVTCTDDEVSSLKTLETDLETMEAAIDSALTAVQAALAGAKIMKYFFYFCSIYITPLLSCHGLHGAHQLGHQQGEAQAEPQQHQDLAVARFRKNNFFNTKVLQEIFTKILQSKLSSINLIWYYYLYMCR